jgi:phage FluMu protein Com
MPMIKFRCARCQRMLRVPAESLGNNARCPECQLLMEIPTPRAKSASPHDDTRPGLPWEQGPRGISSLLDTAMLVSFRPARAFSDMRRSGPLTTPMLYAAICYAAGFVGMVTWDSLLTSAYLLISGNNTAEIQLALLSMAGMLAAYLLLGVPFAATLGNLMNAGILHIALIIAGGSNQPFATTFRIASYTQSSLMWLAFLPLGMLAVGPWSIVLTIFAIQKAHEVPLPRAAIAAILPLVLLLVVALIAGVIFIAGLTWMLIQG